MRAMILAAGLGTRLRPLTNDRPKALVEVGGHTLLEITLQRLASFGIREVIVNVHHFAEMIVDYLTKNANFGMYIEISREDVLLDTGGGLRQAAWFFLEDGPRKQPFLLHNVDVISTIDLHRMIESHHNSDALATLAVQQRQSSRLLLFDENNQLCGRQVAGSAPEIARPSRETTALAFSGVHVISPDLLPRITEQGVFSIITTYLRLAAEGQNISAFHADNYYWRDLGKPDNVTQVAKDLQRGILPSF